jgi:signal transduction histidine kinase
MTATTPVHILIVDDVLINIKIMLAMLRHDYATSFATSGHQALELLAKGSRPDLILLDVMMPEMDGYAVCAALKGNTATRDIPVIFVTARNDADSETRALSAGGRDFIHKPVNAAVLLTRVGLHLELVRQAQALSQANAELTRHRDHLETLVQARTLELAAARDTAESANRAKSAFLSMMGHELRTPLNHIIGLGYLLATKDQDEQAQRWLAKSQEACQQLLGLLNDILDYSSSEAELIQLQAIDFELEQLLDLAASDIRQGAADKGLELVREVDPALPGWLTGDPLRLRQVLAHLLGNAVKFSERGPIRLRLRQLAADDQHRSVRFEVEDHGIGIPLAEQTNLFQGFHQIDSSLARKFGGTGLGLALCHRLVELMAGEMGVISTPGQGSTFWFSVRLPVGAAPTDRPAAPAAPIDWPQAEAAIRTLDQLLTDHDFDARVYGAIFGQCWCRSCAIGWRPSSRP